MATGPSTIETMTKPDREQEVFDKIQRLVDTARRRTDAFVETVGDRTTEFASRADDWSESVSTRAAGLGESISDRIESLTEKFAEAFEPPVDQPTADKHRADPTDGADEASKGSYQI